MKRVFVSVLIVLFMVGIFAGCSSEPKKEEAELELEKNLWKLEGKTEYLLFSSGKRVTAYDISLLDGKVREAHRYLTYILNTDEQGNQTISFPILNEAEPTQLVFNKETKGFTTTDTKQIALQPISVSAFVDDFSKQIKQIEKNLGDEVASQSEMNEVSGMLCCYWDSLHEALTMHLESILDEKDFEEFKAETKSFETERDAAVQQAGKEVEGGSAYPVVTGGAYCTQTEKRIQAIVTEYFS